MISPMTKYSFLVYHHEYIEFLDKLRDIGVVHILEKKVQIPDEIREQYQHIDHVDKIIRFLKNRNIEPQISDDSISGEDVFNEITALQLEIDQKTNKLNSLSKEINELKPWGDFSIEQIKQLEENNIIIRFFITQIRKFDPVWTQKYTIEEINRVGGNIYFAVILHDNEEINIQAEEIKLNPQSLSSLSEASERIRADIENIENRFTHLAKYALPSLEIYKNSLIQKLEYQKVVQNTSVEAEEQLRILEGWVPREDSEKVNSFLDSTGAVYITRNPEMEDKIPILLKNKGFAKKFEVLGELYSLPKYAELDLTPFFAPFYALFFGFCLGDVGYGILISITALFLKGKVKKEIKPITVLIFYLGLATILFGLIGGTFFGINLYHTNLPVYRSLQINFEEKGTDINSFLFYLSLVFGAIQIFFGMVIKAVNEIKQYGIKLALGTIGWIFLLLGMATIFALNKFAGISMEILNPAKYGVLIIGGILILFLNNLKRNILMNFGVGLWNSYNMITGIIGDLLSYIRLFALGISSAILGFVFNSLAVSMSGDIPVLSTIIMVVILVFGHGINLFMSGLGAFVHPMRLTFVEFYKNAGFSGGGKKYNPFRKII